VVTLTIVAAELLSVLYGKWLATGWLHELIDGAVILGLTLPALGYFFARPLTAALREKARAEAALQDLCRDLDEKVRERTARLEGLNQSPQVSREELKGSRQALRTHLALRLAAQEEDRRGVARELHDGIGQSLTAAKMRVEQAAGGQPWQGRESRPELLLSVVPLLQQSLEDLKTALFRIAQEALNNLAKHACARQAAVSLQSDKGRSAWSSGTTGWASAPGGAGRSPAAALASPPCGSGRNIPAGPWSSPPPRARARPSPPAGPGRAGIRSGHDQALRDDDPAQAGVGHGFLDFRVLALQYRSRIQKTTS